MEELQHAVKDFSFLEVFRFFGIKLDMTVYLDSSAARGVVQRQGCGRIRHLEVKSFGFKVVCKGKLFKLKAVPSAENLADCGTKGLPRKRFLELRRKLNVGPYQAAHVNAVQEIRTNNVNKQILIAALVNLLRQRRKLK